VVLRHLRGEIFLALKQGSDVVLKLDEFASDRFGRSRTDEASAEGPAKTAALKNGNVAYTHEQPPSVRRAKNGPTESPTLA